jgi:molybdate transport system substrate-binding protein
MAITYALAALAGFAAGGGAGTKALKLLTGGTLKQVALGLRAQFERQTGATLSIDNATAGMLRQRIEGGEAFDVVVVTPQVIDALAEQGLVAPGSRVDVARVGVGVVVREGAAKPDIGTVEAFKAALLAAKSVAYTDPESGGSSGIYVDKLLDRLGIADAVRPKAKLKFGGYVADLVASGEVELGIHQISEIVPVKGTVLVGPLPPEIQHMTLYAAALSTAARDNPAAQALIKCFSSPAALALLKANGLAPAS